MDVRDAYTGNKTATIETWGGFGRFPPAIQFSTLLEGSNMKLLLPFSTQVPRSSTGCGWWWNSAYDKRPHTYSRIYLPTHTNPVSGFRVIVRAP